ncbi:MAG: YicC/YloC family endoribonuclease, partial [Holophaga sp.]|nr:YicC/YloC family endoribonuclease [Holophaga sp.]
MRSMTAYAEIIHPLDRGQLRLALRSVNHKALDLNVRMHPALFPLENAIRTAIREAASRGKLDLTLEVMDEPSLEPQINRSLLRSVAKTWQEDAEWLNLPSLTAEAFFRLPGAWLPPTSDLAERMESAVLDGLRELLKAWNAGRSREGQRLETFFDDSLNRLRTLVAFIETEAVAQAAELPEQYRQKLDQILKDAQLQGQLPAERLIAEAGALAERQ